MEVFDQTQAQLEEANEEIQILSKEKIVLLEAYEDLEQDTATLIDEAVLKQQQTMEDLQLQVKVLRPSCQYRVNVWPEL
jgi:flagellar biosynthesis/type III secretory pathway chaperone